MLSRGQGSFTERSQIRPSTHARLNVFGMLPRGMSKNGGLTTLLISDDFLGLSIPNESRRRQLPAQVTPTSVILPRSRHCLGGADRCELESESPLWEVCLTSQFTICLTENWQSGVLPVSQIAFCSFHLLCYGSNSLAVLN